MVMGPMTANVTMHDVTHRNAPCDSSFPDGRFIPKIPASSVPCVSSWVAVGGDGWQFVEVGGSE